MALIILWLCLVIGLIVEKFHGLNLVKFACMVTGQEEEKLRLLWFGFDSCLINIISLQMGCVRC